MEEEEEEACCRCSKKCMQDADEQKHQRVVKSSELSLRYRSPERTNQTLTPDRAFCVLHIFIQIVANAKTKTQLIF